MTGEHGDLLAAHALGLLSGEEAARADALAGADPALAAELAGHRATVAALEAGLPRAAPAPALLDAILLDAAPRPAPRRRRRRAPRLALAGGLALAAATATAALVFRGGPEPVAEATVSGEGVHGTARLYEDELVVSMDGVPAPPAGHHYQVWVLREGAEAMEAVGTFTEDGAVELELPLAGASEARALDVSVEQDGGDPGHSGTSLAGGNFG